jgi:hypothetical protein
MQNSLALAAQFDELQEMGIELMTEEQFKEHACDVLTDGLEGLYEQIAEHNGEVARFGDSGPGRMRQLLDSVARVHEIERQMARLHGAKFVPTRFSIRSPR